MRNLIYLMIAVLMLGCSTEETDTGKYYPGQSADLYRNNGKGKGGKKARVVQLELANTPQLATQVITNIMLDPVEIPDTYTTPLPEAIGTSALVDWNGDGIDELFEIHSRCYFPRSFSWVTVDGVTINNSIKYGAQLLGFDDVDGDGDLDALFEGGNHYRYNSDTPGTADETYSPFNVGYNTVGETPQPLANLLDDLVVAQSVNNPDFIRWSLGEQYDAFVFHVYWHEVDPVSLIQIGQGYQTTTYGEWGIGTGYLPVSGTVAIRFTNADDTNPEDECADKWIYVTF